MRRLPATILALALLLVALPAPAGTHAGRAASSGCPVSVTPAHGGAVRVSIPLLVVLEWDAAGTTTCAQWTAAMERASAFLEDASGGQVALGPVTIQDDARDWAKADIQVHVQNTGIPDATVGGLAPDTVRAIGGTPPAGPLSPTSTVSSGGVFMPGAIHLGRSWSEFGPRRGRWSDPDGYSTIVHELGHYAFYLYDEYFGYAESGGTATRADAACTAQLFNPATDMPNPLPVQPDGASIMYWEYALPGFWTGTPPVASAPGCAQGRQWQVYGQPDWQVIAAHYPIATPSSVGSTAPSPPACADCASTGPARWLLNFTPADQHVRKGSGLCGAQAGSALLCLQADGYLVKAGDRAVLHEGVPYPVVPPGVHTIPTASGDPPVDASFYPARLLDVLGGARGEVARVTLTDPRDPSGLAQAVQRLSGPHRVLTPAVRLPAWYDEPLPAVPLIAAQPLVSGGGGSATVTGLRISASNPLGTPFTVAPQQGQIGATLFEAGQGRQAQSTLARITPFAGGHEQYAGTLTFAGGAPILDGSLYLTPPSSETGHEDPARPGGGAWALATYSLSCNSPTLFAGEHAPGDEGGIDSADGVVNVHLPAASDIPNLCVGFTGQVTPPPTGGLSLGQTYAVVGSTPLPAGTAITLHIDRDGLLGSAGAIPGIVRQTLQSSLPTTAGPPPNGGGAICLLSTGVRLDATAGTISATLAAASSGNAAFQATLLTPAAAAKLPKC
jgi:hypothetical protein